MAANDLQHPVQHLVDGEGRGIDAHGVGGGGQRAVLTLLIGAVAGFHLGDGLLKIDLDPFGEQLPIAPAAPFDNPGIEDYMGRGDVTVAGVVSKFLLYE